MYITSYLLARRLSNSFIPTAMASAANRSPQLLLFFLLISTCFLPPPLSLDAKEEADNNTVEKVDSPELSLGFDFSNASSYDAATPATSASRATPRCTAI
jgi:hypothetical protein